MAIAFDRDLVEQLRRRLSNWNPSGRCTVHSTEQCCEYNKQGQLLSLHLCKLSLRDIPSDVWQFSALQGLYLSDNLLSGLPAEIESLSSLQGLHLSGNRLSSLPAEIGKLSELELLYLDRNQLSRLPAEMRSLSNLRGLSLKKNPLRLPPDVIGRGLSAILAYLQIRPDKLDIYLASQQVQHSLYSPSLSQTIDPIDIFISYDDEDELFCKALEKHLSGLHSQGIIAVWHDRHIPAGTDRQQTVNSHLEKAHLILLLVSPDFMASRSCFDEELQRAMHRHANNSARVMPILLRPVDWHGAPFASLPFLPSTGEPISRWSNRDDAFLNVVQGIRSLIHDIFAARLQRIRNSLQVARSDMEALRNPYTKIEHSLSDMAREQERLEQEIAALQQRLQTLQLQRATLPHQQCACENEKQSLQHNALSLRKQTLALEQEERQLQEQMKKIQPK